MARIRDRCFPLCLSCLCGENLTGLATGQRAPDGFVERGLGLGVLLSADLALLTIDLQLEQLFLHRLQQLRITIANRRGWFIEVGEIGGRLSSINCAAARCFPRRDDCRGPRLAIRPWPPRRSHRLRPWPVRPRPETRPCRRCGN